jgi:hypothetical protein
MKDKNTRIAQRAGPEPFKDPMIAAVVRDLASRLNAWSRDNFPNRDPFDHLRDLAHSGALVLHQAETSTVVDDLPAELMEITVSYRGDLLVSCSIAWHGSRVVGIDWHGLGHVASKKGEPEGSPVLWLTAPLGGGRDPIH